MWTIIKFIYWKSTTIVIEFVQKHYVISFKLRENSLSFNLLIFIFKLLVLFYYYSNHI